MSGGPAVERDRVSHHSVPQVSVLPRGLVVLQGLSAVVLTAAGIWLMAWLIAPVFLALIIVISVSPVQTWLRRRGVRHWLATTAMLLSVVAVLVVLAVVLVISIGQLAALLPQYAGRAQELVDQVIGALGRFGVGADEVRTMADAFDPGKLSDLVGSMLSAVGDFVSNAVLVLCLLLFLSLEFGATGTRLAHVTADRPGVATALSEFVRGTRRYMIVTTVFGVITGVLDGALLALLGVPLPVLWGLLAFVTNYIPNVGLLVGLAPPALLALLDGGLPVLLGVVAGYIVINIVLDSMIQPRFLGNAVGLSTTATFVALLLWTWLLGPLGAILAVPFTLLGKALLIDVDPRAGWLLALIGSRTAAAPPAAAET
jgi:AI-2 transport protein TqsA